MLRVSSSPTTLSQSVMETENVMGALASGKMAVPPVVSVFGVPFSSHG